MEEIIYEGIDLEMVQKAARNTFGSGGPSKVDADIWKQMLCSKKFSPQCEQLSCQIALLARTLSKRFVNPTPLQELLACRLIPLDKEPQSEQLKIRPIGVGEIFRRIIGKCLMMLLKPELTHAAGSLKPLINRLKNPDLYSDGETAKQVWFADDSCAAGKLTAVLAWWKELQKIGPGYGYFPKPEKSVLVVKTVTKFEEARNLFGSLRITLEGSRYLGGAIGSESFKEVYVKKKADEWINDIEQISEIAKIEPQIAYCGYMSGISKRWLFTMRTIPDISLLFKPLEEKIQECLIPSLVHRRISSIERKIFALPVRLGGMFDPTEISQLEYKSSLEVTEQLTSLIVDQIDCLQDMDESFVAQTNQIVSKNKALFFKNRLNQVLQNAEVSSKTKRALELANEKGSSTWLQTTPSKEHGFILNKQEFVDAMCLRYGWSLGNLPSVCACGQPNDMEHCLICKKGGFVVMRPNVLRNTEGELLQEVCKDVQIEPTLIPLEGEKIDRRK